MKRPQRASARKRVKSTTTDLGPQSVGSASDADLDPAWISRVRQRLIEWYDASHRDLPWRTDREPYRILVSEMMLVQTTVAAVLPYFERFLRRFPTPMALAEADETDVLKAWEGLGYYRRARQLHAAAKVISSQYGGTIPDDLAAVRALPGVGRYIAGAVLSFAFDRPAAILEANTQRVLARWLAWQGDLKASATQARLWEAAERLVPETGAGVFNQAFMELGALVCTVRAPTCLICPVASECRARLLGLETSLPNVMPKPAPLAVEEACALVFRHGRVLIVKRGPGGLWDGFWEFPTIHASGADPAARGFGAESPVPLADGVRRLTGVRAETGAVVRTVTFSVTRHRVTLNAFQAVGLDDDLTPGPGLVDARWERPEALADYLFGTAGRRLIAWLNRPATVVPATIERPADPD